MERAEKAKPQTRKFRMKGKLPALLKPLAQIEKSELSGELGSKVMWLSKVVGKGRLAHQPGETIASA